ncbi:MAG: PAS domain-containing sensor histidine kinase, partial [Actinomycetota bacterium]|nr:PAS domain-containing sensor histidine kinase [Actinomycetota bacterium]
VSPKPKKQQNNLERYRLLFESLTEGIVGFDLDWKITECNAAFAKILGYETSELGGLSNFDITPPEWHIVDRDIFDNQLKKAGYTDEYTKELLRKDGSRVPVSTQFLRIKDSSGKSVGSWARVEDITERRRYESFIRETLSKIGEVNEKLKENEKSRSEFLAVISHELRAPLGAMKSSVDLLKRTAENGEISVGENTLLEVIERGITRIDSLVEDLVDLARIESGKLFLRYENVDVREIVEGASKSLASMFLKKGLNLEVICPDEPCPAWVDPRRIEQVLSNLLQNAVEFTKHGGVTVRLEQGPESFTCYISDTGVGIPPELKQKIFEKFYLLESTGSEGQKGLGLGLAVCKGIVYAHGGKIWAQDNENGGATFAFEIPKASRESDLKI